MPFTTIDLTKAVTGVLPDANANYSTHIKNAQPVSYTNLTLPTKVTV